MKFYKISNRIKSLYFGIIKKTYLGRKLRVFLDDYYAYKNSRVLKLCNIPKVLTEEETIEKIIKDKCSVCRFGDGEFKWMCNIFQWSYQEYNPYMAKRLKEIIFSHDPNMLICIPGVETWKSNDIEKEKKSSYWDITLGKYRNKWYKYLDFNRIYGNANINRPYHFDGDDRSKSEAYKMFTQIKTIWNNKSVILIEGKYTRFGYGNDLLNNANSIQRILGPEKNSYDVIEKVEKFVIDNIGIDKLILCAFGPTATILCYDLCKKGYQAIDIGHLDILYEQYLLGSEEMVPIKNKYVNEATHLGGDKVDEINDIKFKEQIIKEIYE